MVTAKLQPLVQAIDELSTLERLSLLRIISDSLSRIYEQKDADPSGFWTGQTLEQLLQTQQTRPIEDIRQLRADFWPEDESADDLIEYVYGQRQEDRSRELG